MTALRSGSMPEGDDPRDRGTRGDSLDELKLIAEALEQRKPLPGCLRCVECGVDSDQKGGARGWWALLTVDDEAATYCPECAREEFGDG